MKKSIMAVCFLVFLTHCVEMKKQNSEQTEATEETTDTIKAEENTGDLPIEYAENYFKATGTEPFWGLKIYGDKVELSTIEGDTIIVPHTEPIRVQDANIKMYRAQTEATSMDVIISQKECTNAMSGEVSPYSVTISYKKTGEEETHALEGCGSYVTDYRLNDIWVLEEMMSQKVSKEEFNGKDVPYMEIYTNDNRFSGFSGCNRMTGSLFYEKDLLRFAQIASTQMACSKMDRESEFLKALQSGTTYKVENNRLYLSNGSQENLLIFKKID
ncbi:META domain-containing protein [Flagellimonas taeanensis]|uniref:META domain-containing protein n=1 Tax=Flavobacteriaceae TaxID=49546 RepID=UPI000E67CE6D|nr:MULTISPECIES: META domain-containing protein [Allomuricauda]MDC6385240.1 META domain-containing protein [Muricauda sp. SK9]RIV52682.1 META domain-containing protein [Allomuricauda taeanensis]